MIERGERETLSPTMDLAVESQGVEVVDQQEEALENRVKTPSPVAVAAKTKMMKRKRVTWGGISTEGAEGAGGRVQVPTGVMVTDPLAVTPKKKKTPVGGERTNTAAQQQGALSHWVLAHQVHVDGHERRRTETGPTK